jgi:hypothetical protein
VRLRLRAAAPVLHELEFRRLLELPENRLAFRCADRLPLASLLVAEIGWLLAPLAFCEGASTPECGKRFLGEPSEGGGIHEVDLLQEQPHRLLGQRNVAEQIGHLLPLCEGVANDVL